MSEIGKTVMCIETHILQLTGKILVEKGKTYTIEGIISCPSCGRKSYNVGIKETRLLRIICRNCLSPVIGITSNVWHDSSRFADIQIEKEKISEEQKVKIPLELTEVNPN